MYTLDKQQMSIRHHQGKELKSTVAWHFVAALFLQHKTLPHTQGELSAVELMAMPFFSRYNRNSLRTTIARTISNIEEHFPILSYTKKSSGPWRLASPADFDAFPSLEAVQLKAKYNPGENQRLSFEDGQPLFRFAQLIIEGDCQIHTGNQQEAALNSYRQAAQSSTPLLQITALLRKCLALLRLGDFERAGELLEETDWGPEHSYAGFHSCLLKYRLDQLSGKNSVTLKSPEAINIPDDVTTALTLTLNAFAKREQARKLKAKPNNSATATRLARESVVDQYNSLFHRLRASHYDGVQQSAYNIANTFYHLTERPYNLLTTTNSAKRIFAWSDLCDSVCGKFEVGNDTYLNDLLRAQTLARDPATFSQALPAAQEAYRKSQENGNLYDQNELSALINRLSGS